MSYGSVDLGMGVAVEAKDRKGQRFFHLRNALADGVLAAVPDRARLSPLRVHIGQRHAPYEIAGHQLAAVRPRLRHVPMLGAHRDLLRTAACRSGPAPKLALAGASSRFSIAAMIFKSRPRSPSSIRPCSLKVMRQPQGHRRLQTLATRLLGSQRDHLNTAASASP